MCFDNEVEARALSALPAPIRQTQRRHEFPRCDIMTVERYKSIVFAGKEGAASCQEYFINRF